MSTLNKCLFIGNLTRNVVSSQTHTGLPVCNFTLAVSSRRREPEAAPLFLPCTAWRKSAEFLTQHTAKGDQLMVEGHLELQSWTDPLSGEKHSKMVLQVRSAQLTRRTKQDGQTSPPPAKPRKVRGSSQTANPTQAA